jgi:hypothetical protein
LPWLTGDLAGLLLLLLLLLLSHSSRLLRLRQRCAAHKKQGCS